MRTNLRATTSGSTFFRMALGIFVLFVIPIGLMLPNGWYWSDNGDLLFTFKWFFLPALLASVWLFTRRRVRDRMPPWQRYVTMPIVSLLLVAVVNGPVLVANALLSTQEVVVLEGVVVEKTASSIRSNARIVFEDGNTRYRWPVSSNVYQLVKIGDRFRIHVLKGGLGIYYVRSNDRYWELNPKTE